MKFKKLLTILLALTLVLGMSVPTSASTTQLFIGKGSVQTALGWNNAQLQSSNVSFSYNTVETYSVTEYWENDTGKGVIKEHTVTITKTASVQASVVSESRKNSQSQITGFNLTIEKTNQSENIPAVGDALSGNRKVYDDETGEWKKATITDVVLISSEGGLYVNGVLLQ